MFVQRTARRVPSRQLRRSQRVAFTLLEVLLVLAILVVLASLAVTVFSGSQKQAKIDQAKNDVNAISQSAEFFKLHMGAYPQNLEELKVNPGSPNWRGPYIKLQTFTDPWGSPYEIVGVGENDSALIIRSQGDPNDSNGQLEIISNY